MLWPEMKISAAAVGSAGARRTWRSGPTQRMTALGVLKVKDQGPGLLWTSYRVKNTQMEVYGVGRDGIFLPDYRLDCL